VLITTISIQQTSDVQTYKLYTFICTAPNIQVLSATYTVDLHPWPHNFIPESFTHFGFPCLLSKQHDALYSMSETVVTTHRCSYTTISCVLSGGFHCK